MSLSLQRSRIVRMLDLPEKKELIKGPMEA